MTQSLGLDKVTGIVGSLLDNAPAPIQRNFLKAFGQLCTVAIDVPVAFLEGISAERRAITQARIQIVKSEGDKISEQIDIPQAYIKKASEKYAAKIIREQINLDDIATKTAEELGKEDYSSQKVTEKAISEDWLNEFENNARQMSTEEMRLIFSKILANEVKNPGHFSIRTIRIISQLDNTAATLFQKLCSCAISVNDGNGIHDVRVVSFDGNPNSNSLGKYGLHFMKLNILQEYGLIISDYNSSAKYVKCIVNKTNWKVPISFQFGSGNFAFLPINHSLYDKDVKLHGVALTNAGKELYNIIPIKLDEIYKEDFELYLKKRFLNLISVNKM